MNADTVKFEIQIAFASITKPMLSEVISHDCRECYELRDDLSEYSVIEIPDSVMVKHCWDLPLLSDEGKQYFLPAWMLRSIDDPEADCAESLLTEFSNDHRWNPITPYSAQQRNSIEKLLRYLDGRINPMYQVELKKALRKWVNAP